MYVAFTDLPVMHFPHDFLDEIARTKKLTDLEIEVFLLLFGQDKNKVQIAEELTNKHGKYVDVSVVTTRLTGIYKKFGINDRGPVKERELRRYLEERQKRKPASSQPSTVLSQFQSLIQDKTKDFVGREYVFDAIQAFVQDNPKGYFTIIGDPGQGKSAILAKYVQDTDCIAHFNLQVVGPKSADKFLESVCTQLIERYFLSPRTLPYNATQNGEFLGQLLEEVAATRNNKPVIIAVDALDEVDLNSDRNANILYLPLYLPEGIYFIMTIRRGVEVPFYSDTPQDILNLLNYQEDSQRDVRQYVHNRVNSSDRMRSRIEERRETLLEFIDKIAAKSENNFMYLRYVLQDIEKGLYQDLTLERFPQGLQSYYGFHWRRMGMTATPLPDEKIKIVYILGEVLQPISSQQICDFSGEDKRTVQAVLNEWEQFLHELEKDRQKRYIVYHASFRDFLHQKDILEKTGLTIPGINQLIVNSLTKGLFDDEEDI